MRGLWNRIALVSSFCMSAAYAGGWTSGADEIVWPGSIQAIEQRLGAPSAEERRSAAAELGRLPDNVQRRLLPRLFADPDPEVRLRVADAALQIRLPEAGARVLKWLNDGDARVRAAAAEVLGVLPHPGSAAALGRVLEDPDVSVRSAAALALGNSESPDASLFLLGHLDDSDPEVRHAVIAALEDLGDARAVVPLIGRIQEPRAPLRRQAVAALGTLGDARAATALIVALNDPDSTVRAAAAVALGQLRYQEAVWSLGALLDTESDPEVQNAVLNALAVIGTAGSVEAMLSAAQRRQWFGPRLERALARAGEGALPSLERCVFQASQPEAASSCVAALGAIGGQHATALISRALREGVVEATRALPALADCGDRATLPAVLEYLTAASPAERRAAIEAASRLLDPEQPLGLAVEPIVLAATRARGNRLERAALIGLLGRTGSPRAAKALLPIAASNDEYQRSIAIEALGQLGPAGADAVLLAALDASLFPTRWTAAIALRRVGTRASLDELTNRLERAPAGQAELIAVALAGPLAGDVSDDQLARVLKQFEVSSGAVKDALLEALAGVADPRGARVLEELAQRASKASRAKVAEALGGRTAGRETLLRLTSDPDSSVRANAVWSLGDAALGPDVPRLVQLRADEDVVVASNAIAALARSARRLGVEAEPLCAALEDGRSYVLVNALVGLRLTGQTCSRTELPFWLLQHHPSDEVRIAAAELIRARSERLPGAEPALARCVRKDVSGRVAAACGVAALRTSEHAAPAASASSGSRAGVGVSVLVVPAGSAAPAPRAPFALVHADGFIRSGTSDRRGSVWESAAPRGSLRLAVPAVFSD